MEALELVISAFIRENGGRDNLADTIDAEWCKTFSQPKRQEWKRSEIVFLMKNFRNMTYEDMGRELGRPTRSVRGKIDYMHQRSLIDYKNLVKV